MGDQKQVTKVLFVRSYNSGEEPISTRQGISLQKKGIEVVFFNIIGKGARGYLSNLSLLRQCIKKENPDLIHAHYSLSGMLALLTFSRLPIIVSLMGSDVLSGNKLMLAVLKILSRWWKAVIVKSEEIYTNLGINEAVIVPNGVDMDIFRSMPKKQARDLLKWTDDVYHILFASDPKRPEKNFDLAAAAVKHLKRDIQNIKIHFLKDLNTEEIVLHYNACDCLLLTSFYEGSPNVIKEAMACACPIVSTNVGDVAKNLERVKGGFVSSFKSSEIADNISKALKIDRTNGRECLMELGLNADNTAAILLDIYAKALKTDT